MSVIIQWHSGVDGYGMTYERNTTVSAGNDLGLVGVDEDLGVTERTTAAVTADDFGLGPADGLSVNEVDSGIWLRLNGSQSQSLLAMHG